MSFKVTTESWFSNNAVGMIKCDLETFLIKVISSLGI